MGFRSNFALAGAAMAAAAVSLALSLRPGRGPREARWHVLDRPAAHPPTPGRRAGGRGRSATGPSEVPVRGWKDIVWRTYQEIVRDRVMAVAAGVAFYALLSLFPAIAALISVYGIFADRATVVDHLDVLAGFLPIGAIEIVGNQLDRLAGMPPANLSLGFVFGFAVALWSANYAMKAMFDALNVAYGEEEKRGFLAYNLVTLGFTLATIVFIVLALVFIVVLPAALAFVGADVGDTVLGLLRWPILLVALLLVLSVIYRYGPSRSRARWRWITLGSALAAVIWLAASFLFSWYVQNFGAYNEMYGSLGAVIAFLVWMWLSAVIVLVGAEFDAETEHQTAQDSTVGPDKAMGRRGAYVADTLGPAVTGR